MASADGMGGWFYQVSGVYHPPKLFPWQEVLLMRAEMVLRFRGELIAREMCSEHVPERRATEWLEEWQDQVDRIVKGNVTIQEGVEGLAGLAEAARGIMTLCNLIAGRER